MDNTVIHSWHMLLVSEISLSSHKQPEETPLMLTSPLTARPSKKKEAQTSFCSSQSMVRSCKNGKLFRYCLYFPNMQPSVWCVCSSCSSKWCDYSQESLPHYCQIVIHPGQMMKAAGHQSDDSFQLKIRLQFKAKQRICICLSGVIIKRTHLKQRLCKDRKERKISNTTTSLLYTHSRKDWWHSWHKGYRSKLENGSQKLQKFQITGSFPWNRYYLFSKCTLSQQSHNRIPLF